MKHQTLCCRKNENLPTPPVLEADTGLIYSRSGVDQQLLWNLEGMSSDTPIVVKTCAVIMVLPMLVIGAKVEYSHSLSLK